MLNPRPITDAIAAALQSIPALAQAMTVLDANRNAVCRIAPFHYRLGAEHRLAETIYKMPAPSMLVVFVESIGGNFDGQTIWKHKWEIYFRMGNAAGLTDPIGYEDLWWILCNGPLGQSTNNIRQVQLYPGLDIMDTPGYAHLLDEDMIDYFRAVIIIPEIGDN